MDTGTMIALGFFDTDKGSTTGFPPEVFLKLSLYMVPTLIVGLIALKFPKNNFLKNHSLKLSLGLTVLLAILDISLF